MLAADLMAAEAYGRHAGAKYGAIARRYVESGGERSDRSLARYVRAMEDRGYRRGTIDLHLRIIAAFYRRQGLEPPRVRGWSYDLHEAHRPAVSASWVEQIIPHARTHPEVTLRERTVLALATTYGLRAGEVAAVRKEDVPGDGRIFLRTEKGGERRWCHLPAEIARNLQTDWPPCNPSEVYAAWDRLWESAGIRRPKGAGLHTVRRALMRDMTEAGVSQAACERFLRWADGGRGAGRMAALYRQPSAEIGSDGAVRQVEVDSGAREFDAEVWARHPYLRWWR